MKYEWLDEYLLAKTGTVKDFKEEWDAFRFLLKDKMYCMVGGDKEGKPIITMKCDPLLGEALRKDYGDIVPGYYMNKVHWNSVYREGSVPDEILKQMLDMSYELILQSFSKKVQKEILEGGKPHI